MDNRTTEDLVRIAHAGGSFRISAIRGTEELVRIAAAAANSVHGARVAIHGVDNMPTSDLIRIAAAGKGAVAFE